MSANYNYSNQQVNSNLDLKLVSSSQESLAASESDSNREDMRMETKRARDRIRALESENLHLMRILHNADPSISQAKTIVDLEDQLESAKEKKGSAERNYNEIMCTFAFHKLQTDEERRQSNEHLKRLSTKAAQLEEENRRLKAIQQDHSPFVYVNKQNLPGISIRTSSPKSNSLAPGNRRRNKATPFCWESLLKGTTLLAFATLLVVVFVGSFWLAHLSSK